MIALANHRLLVDPASENDLVRIDVPLVLVLGESDVSIIGGPDGEGECRVRAYVQSVFIQVQVLKLIRSLDPDNLTWNKKITQVILS